MYSQNAKSKETLVSYDEIVVNGNSQKNSQDSQNAQKTTHGILNLQQPDDYKIKSIQLSLSNSQPSNLSTISKISISSFIGNLVNSSSTLSDTKLRTMFLSKYFLEDHVVGFKKFLLLGQGDFVEELITNIEYVPCENLREKSRECSKTVFCFC